MDLRVPAVDLGLAFLAVLAVSAFCKINKLRRARLMCGFDPPPRYQLFQQLAGIPTYPGLSLVAAGLRIGADLF